ncbi:MAG: class II aldolase/adducin family protein [Verrucomicrobiia bacterium]
MKKVISLKDLEEFLRNGGDVRSLPQDAILTPSARDLLREIEMDGKFKPAVQKQQNPSQAQTQKSEQEAPLNVNSKSPKSDLEKFFNSKPIQEFKLQICDIGRRLWHRAYVDGNGGNIAIRVGSDIVLCTPTLVSKGFMKPEDMCLVDMDGNQLLGVKKRTSEILMHLEIMKKQPKAVASVHCHPPYATAFAVAGIEPPTCMIPEFEVFCGAVPIAPYRTPGTLDMGKLVAELAEKHNTILMANHGVVAWSHLSVEDAYWKMEIIEAYCRTIVVASQLGKQPNTFSPEYMKDLLKIKQNLGIPDPRFGLKECELCDNSDWRPGVACSVNQSNQTQEAQADAEAESIVAAVTERIMAELSKAK